MQRFLKIFQAILTFFSTLVRVYVCVVNKIASICHQETETLEQIVKEELEDDSESDSISS